MESKRKQNEANNSKSVEKWKPKTA
jgi:hypothetical protein